MAELADRLAYTGATAIQAAFGPATELKARRAIAAALRALDEEYGRRIDANEGPIDLTELAGEIERGACRE
jgi:hypothetical protein